MPRSGGEGPVGQPSGEARNSGIRHSAQATLSCVGFFCGPAVCGLDVETEEDHVALLDDVVAALEAPLPCFLRSEFSAVLLEVDI